MSFIKKLKSKDKSVYIWGITNQKYLKILNKYRFEDKAYYNDFIPVELLIEIFKNKDLYADCYETFYNLKPSIKFQNIRGKDDTVSFYEFDTYIVIHYINWYRAKGLIPGKYISKCDEFIDMTTFEFFEKQAPITEENTMIFNMIKSNPEFVNFLEETYLHKPEDLKNVYEKLLQKPYVIEPFIDNQYIAGTPIYQTFHFSLEHSQNLKNNWEYLKNYLNLPKMITVSEDFTLADLLTILHTNPDGVENSEKIADILSEMTLNIENIEDAKLIADFVFKYQTDKYLNKFQENRNRFANLTLNENLKKQLLSEIPYNYTKLQKAYYIYRRLCQILTYDEEYFAGGQKRVYKVKHNDPSKLKDIDFKRNEVICSTGMRVFDEFLEELGIEYSVLNGSDELSKKYFKEHQYTQFKIGDYLIAADMTDGIIRGDMPSEKINNEVKSFNIKTTAERTKIKFYEEIQVVDNYFLENKKQIEFNDAIFAYEQSDKKETFSFEEKKDILLSTFGNSPLAPVDEIMYMIEGKKKLFSEEESDKCRLFYVAYDKPKNLNKDICLACVAVFNTKNTEYVGTNEYYLIIRNDVRKCTLDQIQALFDNDKLKLITKFEKPIPGIRFKLEVNVTDKEGKNEIIKFHSKRNK